MVQDVKWIIIGGPGATKDFVVKNDYFHHEIKKLIAEPYFDVGYSNESGLRELIQRAGSTMDQIELDVERTIVDEFLQEVMKSNPKATYGVIMVRTSFGLRAVAPLLLSDAITKLRIRWFCTACQNDSEPPHDKSSATPSCPECNSRTVHADKEHSMELIAELTILAGHTSAKVRLSSVDTEEGSTRYTAFGGITALLRYPIS